MSKFSIPFGLCVDCVECPNNLICKTKEKLGAMSNKAYNTVMKHLQKNTESLQNVGNKNHNKNKKTRSIKKKNTKSTRKQKRT
jgi:hypothetical protein